MGGETMNHHSAGSIQMHGTHHINVAAARPPFTPLQWQELEHQALIFKYMMAGIPVPPDLLIPIRKSLDPLTAHGLFHHHQHHPNVAWSPFQLGLAKNMDPEPGRCRRTDGKKWRCSKDAFPDSKYCEKHMHRGRHRSRKPVETPASHSSSPLSLSSTSRTTANIPSIANNPQRLSMHSLAAMNTPYTASKFGGGGMMPSNTNNFQIDSGGAYNAMSAKDYRYMKSDVDEHIFFSEASGPPRGLALDSQSMLSSVDNGWRSMQPPKVSQYVPTTTKQQQHSFLSSSSFGGVEPVKVEGMPLRHFFDDWPTRSRDSSTLSWSDLDEDQRSNRSSSTTQLSISIPITSSDFSPSNSRSPPRCK